MLGKKCCIGYDVGCSFWSTVLSSCLGEDFENSGSRFCVNAFHGYSHNYKCQLSNHPNCVPGLGIEDLETLERIFSGSNQLAPITRYASPYRRLMSIHLYFTQWDAEKYANLGLMLYNNYRQALSIIAEKPSFQATIARLAITEEDIKKYDIEERSYFLMLQDEEPKNLHAVAYVEALKDLSHAQSVSTRGAY